MSNEKEKILDRNGFEFEAFKFENEYSAKNLLLAMQEYADQQTSDLQKRIKELEDELSQYKPKLPFEDYNKCIHPMAKRTYIGEGYIKCGVCNKDFK